MHTRILKREKGMWYLQDVLWPFAAGASITLALSVLRGDRPMTRAVEFGFLLMGMFIVTAAVAVATPLGMQFLRATKSLIHGKNE
jgi:hypothetical protein